MKRLVQGTDKRTMDIGSEWKKSFVVKALNWDSGDRSSSIPSFVMDFLCDLGQSSSANFTLPCSLNHHSAALQLSRVDDVSAK